MMAEGGRGLAIVAACAAGVSPEAYPGRTVWAEACWPVAVPSPGRPKKTSARPVPPRDWSPGPAA